MVISIEVAEYKSTYKKLGLQPADMEPYAGKLYGFAREQVEIRGGIELETTFGEHSYARIVLVVDVEASYNVIIERTTLNKLGAIVSTYHLCMKYLVGKEVGRVWVDHRDTRRCYEDCLTIGSRLARAYQPDVNSISVQDKDRNRPNTRRGEQPRLLLAEKPAHVRLVTSRHARDRPQIHMPPSTDSLKLQAIRSTAEEVRRRAVREETKKLLTVSFIREIQYSIWFENVVMVKKASGKWCMCTDYMDLNKACPKDLYPLSSIDLLVDRASSSALLSFMDAYLGYNQIKMHPQDKAKMAFITDAGAYCYKVMPFRLKNAGPTYQRMMDRMFEGMIRVDVEVYVDDMVVKSTSTADHYKSLGRVFQILRKHQLKLNPQKVLLWGPSRKIFRIHAD
ncbi:hypothetical protein CR513_16434, partial [Mucuna pruriens]